MRGLCRRVQESRCRLIRRRAGFLIWCLCLIAPALFFWVDARSELGSVAKENGVGLCGQKSAWFGGEFACTLAQPNVTNFYWLKNNNSRRKGHQMETSGSLAPPLTFASIVFFNQA